MDGDVQDDVELIGGSGGVEADILTNEENEKLDLSGANIHASNASIVINGRFVTESLERKDQEILKLKEEIQKLKMDRRCEICKDEENVKNMWLQPCGHGLCEDCAYRLYGVEIEYNFNVSEMDQDRVIDPGAEPDPCPFCRGNVTSIGKCIIWV